jgi:hypothetical protein
MSEELTQAQIAAQQRVRERASQAVARAWTSLQSYDEDDVPVFLAVAVPAVIAAQRLAASLTNAFLARSVGRQPLPLDLARLIGPAIRNGATPAEVYRRPFVTTWTALGNGTQYEDAVAEGLHRATSTAEMDVQLTMRQTLVDVGQRDELILGYQRVPDPGACDFCRLIAGQRYTIEQLIPVHNHCGCGVDVITAANRGDFTGNPENDLSVTRDGVTAAVEEHGELGPLLVNGDDHFTRL